ncbi:mechanosensitive ion channel family protein [Virgibacillus alimentarius]|uniref:Small conductance mechanosensitive channel n=1 Tax=Virgibacillus alimentarius TaxID=698769 RepID=A0ABS4S5Z6_9BACI|nr:MULTISPECIES: mechanosensitive ion channel family protein [Virgibacillus]MBP2256923.1 small conductance mechanosensitive channel [Virgibacillus alimentarius]HLR68087.1 mechanosensitive ion channel family protein [Virgibacillus sp.]
MDIFGISFDLSNILGVVIPITLKIVFLILAFIILKPIGRKVIEKTIQKTGKSRKVSANRMKTLEKLLVNLYSYILIFLFIVMVFAILNIPIGPLLAGAGIVGLAIGFGAQGIVSDVVTGFFILLERQLEIDDYVTVGEFDGIVEEVGLRTTKIRAFDGTLNFVPNRFIEGVANHSRGNMRALVDISISYHDNIDKAISVLEHVCESFQTDDRFKDGPNCIGVQEIGTYNTILRVVGQTENGLQWECERDLRKQMKEAFEANEITIPYPHQVYIQEKQD